MWEDAFLVNNTSIYTHGVTDVELLLLQCNSQLLHDYYVVNSNSHRKKMSAVELLSTLISIYPQLTAYKGSQVWSPENFKRTFLIFQRTFFWTNRLKPQTWKKICRYLASFSQDFLKYLLV